jgi:hypothetical protein
MKRDQSKKITIARFSGPKAVLGIVIGLSLVIACLAYTFYSPDGELISSIRAHGVVWLYLLPLCWLCGAVLIILFAALMRQMLFDDLRAIWIEGGAVIYLDKRWFSVACAEIHDIHLGTFGRMKFRGIVLELGNGTSKSIPLGIVGEPGATVVARLHETIHQS